MATTLATIIERARTTLLETTASFWTDAELLAHANKGIKDLWKATIDLYQDHIITIDEASASLLSGQASMAGVPSTLFRVVNIQPRTLGTSSGNPGLVFQPRNLTHPDFVQAQAIPDVSPRNNVIYYAVLNAGAPVGAPTIRVAPKVSSDVLLTIMFNPVIADLVAGGTNPIPGESDLAIEAWTIAWARAKERPDRSPDPEFISIYATEKRGLMTVNTPRSIQEPEVVPAFFTDSYGWGG